MNTTQIPAPLIIRPNYEQVCKVKKLFIYPIKAVKGVEVNELEITKYASKLNRSWALLNESNNWIGIKHEPRLALTRTSIVGDELWVDAPDMPTLKLRYIDKLNNNHNILSFRMYGQQIKGLVCSDECNKWFQTFLGKPGVRLLQHHESFDFRDTNSDKRRNDDKEFPIIYQNKSGLHLINESSISHLNSRFSEGADHVCHENFRPNVLVDYPQAWAEDTWKWMRINGVNFMRLLACDRCPSTTVNQKTAVKNMETLVALKKFRPPEGITKKKGLGPMWLDSEDVSQNESLTRKHFVKVCKVKKLFIYPIKGVKGVEVNQLEITKYGVKYGSFRDRSWILLNAKNDYINMNTDPKLVLTRTRIMGQELWVDGPDMPTLKLRYIDEINDSHNIITIE
ncbi:unnamed protein product [Oppiella nova]|uniref:MOSC domain-containing protein n=1 Tax=Oppiella nova TaxID=334625 RepID=A0A7R9LG48_9ACAR|nr:unnamed protein product [Oppiella nova]CAG2163332.1 unnamed protein product [Oppiella nova]